MKKNQYKRLTFVAFFPLLILGLFLYLEEVLIPNNYVFECRKNVYGDGDCKVRWVSSSDKWRVLSSYGLTLNGAVVSDGLATRIIVLETVLGEREEGSVGRPISPSESGVERIFVVSAHVPPYSSPYSHQGIKRCTIKPFRNDFTVWTYRCSSDSSDVFFKFQDREKERLFGQMVLSLEEQKELAKRSHKLSYVYILLPLMAYFLLSLMGWILFRLFSYVKGNER